MTRYLGILRERKWLVLLIALCTIAAAAVYVALAPRVYEASAELLLTPLPRDGNTPVGLGLITDSSDPLRNVETAARLTSTPTVAGRVVRQLHLRQSPASLLEAVSIEPVAQSDIVSIVARAESPQLAERLANGFGDAVVATQTEQLRRELDPIIAGLRQRVRAAPSDAAAAVAPDSLENQLARLETLRAGSDPTLRVSSRADAPLAPVWPRPVLSLAAATVIGAVLGILSAFALHLFDPIVRREEQLRSLFRLPILARVPKEPASKSSPALKPEQLSPAGLEAYRALRATLSGAPGLDQGRSRSILVTGSTSAEGKTTTAINLAVSLAVGGSRVILIESDMRRPSIAKALGVRPTRNGSTVGVLLKAVSVQDALVHAEAYGPNLQLLLADESQSGWMTEHGASLVDQLSLPAARTLVDQAKELADYVVIDAPPLTEVIDALPLAGTVDDVLVVVRLNRSRMAQLTRLGELLAQQGIKPTGFAVIEAGVPQQNIYYYRRPTDIIDGATGNPDPEVAAR